MGSNMKLATQRLIKIADDLEREAAENTFFVCDGCNHTASLADINKKRKVASAAFKVKRTANVSVNDAVTCLACGGKMSYVPTDSSEKFYVESEDTGADIFEPVDERDTEKTDDTSDTAEQDTAEAPVGDETAPETSDTPETSENDMPPAVDDAAPETPDTEKTPDEDTSGIADYDGNPDESEKPEDSGMGMDETPAPEGDAPAPEGDAPAPEGDVPAPEGDVPAPEGDVPAPEGDVPAPEGDVPAPEGEEAPVVEETVGEDIPEGTGEEAPLDEGAPTDETENQDEEDTDADLPKKDVPKFEKIPKEAQDAFWRSVAKYSV